MPVQTEKRFMPYAAQDMFAIVADIEAYPEFLPWCEATRILGREAHEGGEVIEAEMVIGFKLYRETIRSRVTLMPSSGQIKIAYLGGLFKYMRAEWRIREVSGSGSDVAFFIDFQLRNLILRNLIGGVFGEAMRRITGAFERRAEALHRPKVGVADD